MALPVTIPAEMATVLDLPASRRSELRALLNARSISDAMAAYYALTHPAEQVRLLSYHPRNGSPVGFLAMARTGFDLFRPLAVPFAGQPEVLKSLLQAGLTAGRPVLLSLPSEQRPWAEEVLQLSDVIVADVLRLDQGNVEPIINVLLVESRSERDWPRYEIHSQGKVRAAAGLNWMGEHFAEIYLQVRPEARERRFGVSVLSAMVRHLQSERKAGLLKVEEGDAYTLQDALEMGFRMTGSRWLTAQAMIPANSDSA